MAGGIRKVQNPSRIARTKRLAAALRQNMKRRKAQARGRAQVQNADAGASHDSAGIVPERPKG
jgi:hypothetical protein